MDHPVTVYTNAQNNAGIQIIADEPGQEATEDETASNAAGNEWQDKKPRRNGGG
jgi:hypothetical protein